MSRVEKGGRSFRPLAKPNNSLKSTPNPTTQSSITTNNPNTAQPPPPSSSSSSNQPAHHHISIEPSTQSHPQPINPPPSTHKNAHHPTPTLTPPWSNSENDSFSSTHRPETTQSTAQINSQSSTHTQPINPNHVLQPKPTNLLPTSPPSTGLKSTVLPIRDPHTDPIPSISLSEPTKPSAEQTIQPGPPIKPRSPIPIDLSQPPDHGLSPAEKMKLKAKAAKAARATERLKNPSSSRRSTSILSIPSSLADQQSIPSTQSDSSPQPSQVTVTQATAPVEDIPVPTLTTDPTTKVPPPLPSDKRVLEIPSQAWSPPIDPVLAIAAFVEDTTTTTTTTVDTQEPVIPDILVSRSDSSNQPAPPPPPSSTETNTTIPSITPTSHDEPEKSTTSTARRGKVSKKRSAPVKPNLEPDHRAAESGEEEESEEDISPRLRRKRHLEKLRDKKKSKKSNAPTRPDEAQDDDGQEIERAKGLSEKATKRATKRRSESSSIGETQPTKRKKAAKRKPTTSRQGSRAADKGGSDKNGNRLEGEREDGSGDEDDGPLDPTEVSMAELTNPNLNKGQTTEVLEKRLKLIIERRDREKQERMIVREETKKQARQVLIDRIRAVKSKQKEEKPVDDDTTSQTNENAFEQGEGSDGDHSTTEVDPSAELNSETSLPQLTEAERKKKALMEQYGLEDLDSDEEDMSEFEEVIFDEFAKTNKKSNGEDGTQSKSKSKAGSKQASSNNGPRDQEGEEEEEVVEEVEFNEEDYVPQASQYAPQLRVVNGQIVLDQDSLEVDRRDQTPELDEMEVVEESDATRLVNSQTWAKTVRGERWSVDETSLFYDAIRLFGSDFEMIAQLFPGRTRRQIRLKWNKEEKRSPQEITDALMGKRRSSQRGSKECPSPSSNLTPITEEFERDGAEEDEDEDDGGEGKKKKEEEEEVVDLVIPSHLDGFADYARIVGIDCSGPIPVDPMDKWREKDRLEYEEEIKNKKKDADQPDDDHDDDEYDEETVVDHASGWGEVDY